MINTILVKDKRDLKRTAMVDGTAQITYEELISYSNAFANFLISKGYQQGQRVIVYLNRSINAAIVIYGIIKAGLVYVPIDNKIPKERLDNIVKDCEPSIIVCDHSTLDNIYPTSDMLIVMVDDHCGNLHVSQNIISLKFLIENGDYSFVAEKAEGDNLAYIIYTSGSTGIPKGVMISRESILDFTIKYTKYMQYNSNTRMLGITSLSGDGSFIQYFCTHFAGGSIYNHQYETPNLLTKFIFESQITDIDCSATIVKLLANKFSFLYKYQIDFLKTISYGGDILPPFYIREIRKTIPKVKFFNGYGPTECTVLCSIYKVTDEDIMSDTEEAFPIGKPFEGVDMIALNESGKPIGNGEEGELYLGGIQLMKGYWNDPALNSKVFIPHPFKPNEKVYKTGDLVTIDNQGNYKFLRRLNDMIKIRGYRIYISEVENEIKKCPNIKDCFVVSKEHSLLGTIMKAFLVQEKKVDFNINEIKCLLSYKIPEYMVPQEFVTLDSFPILSNGKIDRKALANM